jgi:hypothetical protein
MLLLMVPYCTRHDARQEAIPISGGVQQNFSGGAQLGFIANFIVLSCNMYY